MKRSAIISDCGRYRYVLTREWGTYPPRALCVMLNPSTADAEVDDATIRSCVRLAKENGHGSLEVVNLFAWRATDPRQLATAVDPVGPLNETALRTGIGSCQTIICAWGAHPMAIQRQKVAGLESRSIYFRKLVRSLGIKTFCFGTTKSGAPKHPLYIKSGTLLQEFRS